jgi:MFS transporter, ACS family, tartrate transporter
VLVLSLVYFGTSAGLYTLGVWAPQIIKGFGLSNLEVGFLNAVPPSIAVVAMYLWSWHSDHTNERTWHVVIACLAAAIGLALAGTASSVASVAAKPPLWSMATLFLAGPAAASGIATINSIGNLGGFVGPAMIGWIKDQTGSFAGGLYLVGALLLLSATLTLLLARSISRQPAAAGAH